MKILFGKWPAPFCGFLLALLLLAAIELFGSPVGLSDTLTAVAAYCTESIEQKELASPPEFDWQNGLIAGVFIGALCASLMSADWKLSLFFEDKLRFNGLKSLFYGLLGGFLVIAGSQLAGDIPAGQYSNALQQSIGAWLFLGCFLLTALAGTFLLAKPNRKE